MTPLSVTPPARSISLADIYYALFRHKWKIIPCAILGFCGAAAVYYSIQPPFRSVAKLFVRFVISEGKSVGPWAADATAKSPDQRGETIMTSEKEMILSGDLAKLVAQSVGPEKILAKINGGNELMLAASKVRSGLTVTVPTRSSILLLSYEHPDAEVVQLVLREVIARYLKMHVETHRSVGILGDSLIQETDQLRARLAQTEDELRKMKNRAGVISIEDAKRGYSDQIAGLRREIFQTQASLAERNAVFQELSKHVGSAAVDLPTNETPTVPLAAIEDFRSLSTRIASSQSMVEGLLTQFTAENARVQEVRAQLAELETQREKLLAQHPLLLKQLSVAPSVGVSGTGPAPQIDLTTLHAELTALQAKNRTLLAQLEEIKTEAAKLDEMEGAISELRRKKEMEEANYRYYAATLEQSRINETLAAGRVSNISEIQSPSAPFPDRSSILKLTAILAGSGLVFGLAWALVLELYLDRTVRRPVDLERLTSAPLFISIPLISATGPSKRLLFRRARPSPPAAEPAAAALAAGGRLPFTDRVEREAMPFHETLRDQLITYFEGQNLTHKPKLVAVTGLAKNVGVSSVAAGLARSLSQTGEGNVLLVDMTAGDGSSRQFVHGHDACDIDKMLSTRDSAHVHNNLYLVRESRNSEELSRNLPQRFNKLIPQLKASDFDYILFDMPPVSQISITPRLASFMDMVLLVVESERTDRDLVQRAAALLGQSRTRLGMVLNKTRRYVPARLTPEFVTPA